MPEYTPTDSKRIETMTQGGGKRVEYRVWITTAKGATGSIRVGADDWNEDDLHDILDDFAAELNLAFTVSE